MRGAFVVQLRNAAETAGGQMEGWVEEVDSGKQFQFRREAELLEFLRTCFTSSRQIVAKKKEEGI